MFETWSVSGRRPGDGLEPVTSEDRCRVASPPAPRGRNRGHLLRRRQSSLADEVVDGAGFEEGGLELGFAQATGTAAAGTPCHHVYVDEPGCVEQAAKLAADERAGPRPQRGEDGLAAFQPGVRGGDQGAAPVGVGDTDHGARASDPAGLDERDQRLGEVLQDGAHEDGIDAPVRERQ
jgi:hypothetical protein